MATSWGGVTFYTLADEQDGTLRRPLLVPEDFGTQRDKIPYANQEQIQFTGRGNRRMRLRCEIYSDADFATLLSRVGTGTSDTLTTEWGEAITNMLLVDMPNIWRVGFAEEVHFDAVFEKVPGT